MRAVLARVVLEREATGGPRYQEPPPPPPPPPPENPPPQKPLEPDVDGGDDVSVPALVDREAVDRAREQQRS